MTKIMRVIQMLLVVSLLFAFTGAIAVAQVNQQPQPAVSRATVQTGPVEQLGLPASGDVFVDGRFALRVPAPAGGISPMQRAQRIADRLNEAFQAGETWQNMWVAQINGNWVVTSGQRLIATADTRSARVYGISPAALAQRWARQTVVAMGGEPTLIAMQLEAVPGRVAGEIAVIEPEWAIEPTRTLPLLDAATGQNLGNVVIGGPQAQIHRVNAIVMHQFDANGAIVRTFAPITGEAVVDQMTRVQGVGLTGMPIGMVPRTGIRMGAPVQEMVTQRADQWNVMIGGRLTAEGLQPQVTTRIVPLYSHFDAQIVGAAQIAGSPASMTQTNAVVMTIRNNTVQFRGTAATVPPVGEPAVQQDVVVTALIYAPVDADIPAITPPAPLSPPATPNAMP